MTRDAYQEAFERLAAVRGQDSRPPLGELSAAAEVRGVQGARIRGGDGMLTGYKGKITAHVDHGLAPEQRLRTTLQLLLLAAAGKVESSSEEPDMLVLARGSQEDAETTELAIGLILHPSALAPALAALSASFGVTPSELARQLSDPQLIGELAKAQAPAAAEEPEIQAGNQEPATPAGVNPAQEQAEQAGVEQASVEQGSPESADELAGETGNEAEGEAGNEAGAPEVEGPAEASPVSEEEDDRSALEHEADELFGPVRQARSAADMAQDEADEQDSGAQADGQDEQEEAPSKDDRSKAKRKR